MTSTACRRRQAESRALVGAASAASFSHRRQRAEISRLTPLPRGARLWRGSQPLPARGRAGFAQRVAQRLQGGLQGGVELPRRVEPRSEVHTSELQSLIRLSDDVFCLEKKTHVSRLAPTR